MEHNVDNTLDQLPKTIRLLILSYCDPQTAVRLIQTNKAWYECSATTRVWKQIYFNTFSEFNPKPKEKAKNWKEEIKKKIGLYGLDYEKYRALVGKVKLTSADSKLNHLRRRKEHRLILNGNALYMGDFEPNSIRYRELIEQVFEPLFTANQEVSVTWDFCDEGEPAFEFTKEGLICRLSLVEGTCSGFEADPEWQDVEFLIEDLRAEYIKFLEELQRELLTNYGKDGKRFWKSLNIDWTKYK